MSDTVFVDGKWIAIGDDDDQAPRRYSDGRAERAAVARRAFADARRVYVPAKLEENKVTTLIGSPLEGPGAVEDSPPDDPAQAARWRLARDRRAARAAFRAAQRLNRK